MSKRVGWGIAGTGYAAQRMALALQRVAGADAVGVTSRHPEKAREFAGRFGVGRAHENLEALVSDPKVQIVYIATPNSLHDEHCLAALDAGKAVLCEKPFAVNATRARRVVEKARSRQLFCMEAMWMRFIPLFRRAVEITKSGTLGEIRMLTAQFSVPTRTEDHRSLFRRDLGGGALLDRGVYCLSLAFAVLGAPDAVMSTASIGRGGVDEGCVVSLSYANGALALLGVGLDAHGSNEALISGTRGRLRIHEPFHRPHRISLAKWREVSDPEASSSRSAQLRSLAREIPILRRLHQRLGRWFARPESEMVETLSGTGFEFEVFEVMRCLREGCTESELVPLDETVQILEAMDQARVHWARPSRST